MSELRRPRVGHIEFLNCVPIYWGLMRSGALLDVDLTRASPVALNDALVAGELDIAPISLVEYLRHAEDLVLLPGVAVGSDGPVLSVNIVHERPLSALDGGRVALGSSSRTGVLLAQMLLTEKYGVDCEFVQAEPDVPRMLEKADAAVVIGDVALRAMYEAPQRGLSVTDLGAAWRDWAGVPMVFAVWAVRREFAQKNPGQVKAVHDAFLRSVRLCLAELDVVAEATSRWEPFDAATLAGYFRSLDFSLGERQLTGLRAFAEKAAARGEVPPLPTEGPDLFCG